MEFHEKLQELRKKRRMTQEELADALYVSRTAISKWESGRGYPSIDSLKEISGFFSVSIDDLLSSETVLSIAQNENKSNIRRLCDLLFGMVDVCMFLLIVLPLYPKTVEGYVYSVNLFDYTQSSLWIYVIYWCLFLVIVVSGAIKIFCAQMKIEKGQRILTICSMVLSVVTVLFLALTREAYAVTVVFLLLVIKGILLFRLQSA